MQQAKSILLLTLMWCSMLPWSALCTAHPTGHGDHHDHDGPSPCELRADYDGDGTVLWPPMNCGNTDYFTENYTSERPQIQLTDIKTAAVFLVLLDIQILPEYESDFEQPPDEPPGSPPLLTSISYRGPPA